VADRAGPPPDPRREQKGAAVGRQLAELTELDAERLDDDPDGVLPDAGDVRCGQRELAELGDGRLLAGAGPQLGLDHAPAGFALTPEGVLDVQPLVCEVLELRDARTKALDFGRGLPFGLG
jgi:hypothetical protein